jgi:hypothetical protein
VQQQRTRELAAVEASLREDYYRNLIGRPLRVLLETKEQVATNDKVSIWSGTSCRYATVELPARGPIEGTFVDAIAREVRGDRILAS